ncbi:DUF11 domain-containing protein, partial [Xanthomonadaceae bacterium XH05]|nr:DUF11 domain-containing protein [Xanthomonadaceae bacterium XH05]
SPPDEEDTEIQNPSLTLVKSVTSAGPYGAGDTIAYQFVVTNTGNTTLTNVNVTDPLPGLSALVCTPSAPATLAPTAIMTCTASYTVTPTDVEDGGVLNTAIAAGTPPPTPTTPTPTPITDEDEVITPVEVPALSINKTGPAATAPGEQVVFTIVVANAGPVAANSVTVTDPTPTGLVFVSNAGDCITAFPCSLGTLAVGETRTITVTMMVPTNYNGPNEIINTATVSSPSTTETHSSTATVPVRGVEFKIQRIPVGAPWALLMLGMGMLLLGAGAVRRQPG